MSDESLEIIETIRDRRDRALAARGRTAAAAQEMHLGVMDQAIYVDESLDLIDRLTAERDQARDQLAKLRAACDMVATSLEANLGYGTGKPYFWSGVEGRKIVQHTLRNAANNLRAALGIESEAGE